MIFKPIIEEPVEKLAQETENLVIEETTELIEPSSQVGLRCQVSKPLADDNLSGFRTGHL